jgi:hypothetical protein
MECHQIQQNPPLAKTVVIKSPGQERKKEKERVYQTMILPA